MNAKSLIFITTAASWMALAPSWAGVKISSPEPAAAPAEIATNTATPAVPSSEGTEKLVVFATADGKYLTANAGGVVDLSGAKVGSKQKFTIIDLNGGDLADGDSVKIRYTPNTSGVPDPSKASYWRVKGSGIKRGKEAGIFKLNKIDGKFALMAADGKFVTGTLAEGTLSLSDKQDAALMIEVLEVPASGKFPKKPAAKKPPVTEPADD
jgi:hypothetical protein